MFGAMFNVVDRIQTTVKRGYDQWLNKFMFGQCSTTKTQPVACQVYLFSWYPPLTDQISSVVVKYMPIAGHQHGPTVMYSNEQ